VKLNGAVVTQLGLSINPETDVITVDDTPIASQGEKVVYAFNKPSDVVSSMHDDKGRPCLSDYLTDLDLKVHHVGRLDFESSGLLILTNDGELTQKLSHPSHEIEKTYLVNVSTSEPDLFAKRVLQGVALEDGLANADACALISSPHRRSHSTKSVECVYLWQIHDGRNRIIRRVAEALNSEVMKLQRVAIGNYFIGRLREGDIKKLTKGDIDQLLERGSFEKVHKLTVQKMKL
jgi:23S rRNA pseudouridine2605 synthase